MFLFFFLFFRVDENNNDEPLPDITVRYSKYFPSVLYPCQKLNKHGAMFETVPSFSSTKVAREKLCLCWLLSSLLISSQELWSIISKSSLSTSSWYGWFLVYLTKNTNLSRGKKQNYREVFKYSRYMNTIDKFADNILINSIDQAFVDIDKIFFTDLSQNLFPTIYTTYIDYISYLLIDEPTTQSKEIIIINSFYSNIDNDLHSNIVIHGVPYELRVVSKAHCIESDSRGIKWDAEVFARHGNIFSSWWYQARKNSFRLQLDTSLSTNSLKQDHCFVLLYVKNSNINITSIREEYIKYLGGQSRAKCSHHKDYCLVRSFDKSNKCNCGKYEYYRCPDLKCKICICYTCFNNLNEFETSYIYSTIPINELDALENNEENEQEIQLSESISEANVNMPFDSDSDIDGDYLFQNNVNNVNQNINNDLNNDEISLEEPYDTLMHENPRLEDFSDDESFNDGFCSAFNRHTQNDHILEADDFDNYLTTATDIDFVPSTDSPEDHEVQVREDDGRLDIVDTLIETSNAGVIPLLVHTDNENKGVMKDATISGHVILNQCGSLLTRKNHEIKGSRKQSFFIQKLCATSIGSSVPLIYPEALLFPSIFWKMAPDNCSIVGAIPSPLLSQSMHSFGFESIPSHIRSRLTSPLTTTSTDVNFTSFCYDMLTNLSANHQDTRLVLRRGLTVGDDKTGGLGLRGQGDSSMLESFDSKAMVRNLCASQLYHNMSHFLTFTCNMKKHFGTKPIKEWLDSEMWKRFFFEYHDLDENEKKEIDDSVVQAASGLLLRVWQEVCQLFLSYLRKSPSSPYQKVLSIFSRNEYQSLVGNLSHIHLILEVDRKKMTSEQRKFVDDLCRCSILDIVRSNEVQKLINDGTFKSIDDYKEMTNDAFMFLGHKCDSRCLTRTDNGNFRCRKLNYLDISEDNTKHTFLPLPNTLPKDCLDRLIKIGMIDAIEINEEGFQRAYKSKLAFLHPQRHIPPTNPSDDINMSPCEGYTFSNCRSMQNIQILSQSGGVNKYICKYIGKIDEQNYVVVDVDNHSNGALVTKATFLHNTKITSSKLNEDKVKNSNKRDMSHPQGRIISHMEMLHHMLRYPEVITNLVFVTIPSMPIEFRAGVTLETTAVPPTDSAMPGSESDNIRKGKELPHWRQHTENEMRIYEDLKLSNVSIDKITIFSLRPPELRGFIDRTRLYFRWFHIEKKVLKGDALDAAIHTSLENSMFVDHLQHAVKLRERALPEVKKYILEAELNDFFEDPIFPDRYDGVQEVLSLFKMIIYVFEKKRKGELHLLDDTHTIFLNFAEENLVKADDAEHLPVPVYSYIKPNLGLQFIHHLLLSMGRFSTEVDLLLHPDIRSSLRYAQLIGPSNDPDDLAEYSNKLLYNWISEQLQFFPNTRRVLAEWIIIAGDLLDSVIINNEFSISDMPPVQLSTLFGSNDEEIKSYINGFKDTFIDAINMELGNATLLSCNIPSKEDLTAATKSNPLQWNALSSFQRNPVQSQESFTEQKLAIQLCSEAIDKYADMSDQLLFTKNIGIRGFPGSGKTWCSLYVALYGISKGLFVIPTAVLAKRSIQLGGIHYHRLFCIPTEKHYSVHRKAEIALIKILRDARKTHLLLAIDVMICDEIGQLSADFVAVLDIILRRLRDNSLYLGGVLVISTLDHTQIQSIDSRPFLTSSNLIPCFKMVALKLSVRAAADPFHFRIQQIARFNNKKLDNHPELIDEFLDLCSAHFTFYESWDDPRIPPSTMRLYSKKVPAKEAAIQFADRVRRHFDVEVLRERIADDVEKSKFSQMDWNQASDLTSNILDQKLKEPRSLLFFRGAIFTCTFNEKNYTFLQSQMCFIYDIPEQRQLDNWEKIKVLVAPPGMKEIEYDASKSKQFYLDIGFKEVKIGVANEYTQALPNNMQARRKQYGLKHYVSSTIHGAMGDTLTFMATTISNNDSNFNLWDKGQLIVILSRTKFAKNSIFVGSKTETLNALKELLTSRTQWTDYIEEVLDLITINTDDDNSDPYPTRVITPRAYPFRICDFALPTDQSGYVYMLVSVRHSNYTYIGTTNCIRSRLVLHNTGVGAIETAPAHLRPFGLYAYVCGFGGVRRDLRYYIERRWKEERDILIQRGINDPRRWARSVTKVISNISRSTEVFGVIENELTLVCLFED